MLDQLSKGRVEVGLARGLYGREAANLNTLADPANQEQNRALFEETLEILKRHGQTVSFHIKVTSINFLLKV